MVIGIDCSKVSAHFRQFLLSFIALFQYYTFGEFMLLKFLEIFNLYFRFRHTAAHASWDVSSGACDAIALSVDQIGITLHGVGVYCAHHDQEQSFVCEVNVTFFISRCLLISDNFHYLFMIYFCPKSYYTTTFRYCLMVAMQHMNNGTY